MTYSTFDSLNKDRKDKYKNKMKRLRIEETLIVGFFISAVTLGVIHKNNSENLNRKEEKINFYKKVNSLDSIYFSEKSKDYRESDSIYNNYLLKRDSLEDWYADNYQKKNGK